MSWDIRPLPHAGPRGPGDEVIHQNAESVHFDMARREGLKPRVERKEPLPPIYATCNYCGAEAPEAKAYLTVDGGERLKCVGCMKCIAGQIIGGE